MVSKPVFYGDCISYSPVVWSSCHLCYPCISVRHTFPKPLSRQVRNRSAMRANRNQTHQLNSHFSSLPSIAPRTIRSRLLIMASLTAILPAEVVHIALAFLPKPDLSNFRLASKEFASYGERHIVRYLHIMSTPECFSNLLRISQHPSLSKHVHSIYYKARYLVERPNLKWFTYFILGSSSNYCTVISDLTDETKALVSRAWDVYKPLQDEQCHIRDTTSIATMFGQAWHGFRP